MAIKFRCQHCRQLLGISTTKAGTIVDCPACGRSVHVPIEGGGATEKKLPTHPGDHPGLLSALHELSALNTPNENVDEPPENPKVASSSRKIPVTRAASAPAESSVTSDRDVMRIIPLANAHAKHTDTEPHAGAASKPVLPELLESETVEDSTSLVLPDHVESDIVDFDQDASSGAGRHVSTAASQLASRDSVLKPSVRPHDLSSALQELAGAAPIESQQLQHARLQQSATRGSSLFPLMLILPAFAAGLLLGTFWKSSDTSTVARSDPRPPAIVPKAVVAVPAFGERGLTGFVRYINDSGNSMPDAGAVILLLPVENTSRLRLDARPLREPADSKARLAIETALSILGGSVHQADDAGSWSANMPSHVALSMVVISRHRSRTDSQPVPAEIQSTLGNWFESPLHITGRLSVRQSPIPASSGKSNQQEPSLDIEFSTKP